MVRLVTPADVAVLGGSLARAFDDDPVASFAYPTRRTRAKCLAFYFAKRVQTLLREELSWCDEDRRGAALWAPPDRWRVPLREELSLLRHANRRVPQVVVGQARVHRAHPTEPHLYLSVLGVDPVAQGTGLGSRLLAPGLELCDRDGVGAYLESSKEANLAFYGRHGFRVTGETRSPGGPPLWLMWRDPS